MGCDERYRGYSCFVWFLRLAILGTVFLVTLQGVTAEEPTETQCRPYIEKALKEHHIDETKVSEEKSTEQDSPPTDELTASTPEESGEATKGDDDSNSNEETEEDTQERTKRSLDENTKEDEDESVEGDTKEETKEEVSGEGDTKEENENGADKETQEEADSVEGDTAEENQENEETKEEDSNETDESTEGDSEENDGGENASTEDAAKEDNDEDSKENNTDDEQDTVEDDQGPVEGNTEENQESVEGDTKEDQDSVEGDTKEDQDSIEGDTKEDQDSVEGDTKEDQDSVQGDTKEDQDSVEGDTKEDQDSVEGDTKEDQDSVEKDTKEDQGSIEGDTQEDQESVEGDTREDKESVEGDTREDKESVEGDTREDQKSVEGDTKEDQDSKEGDTKEESSIEGDTKEDQDSVEGDTKEAGSAEADTKEETSIEGDTKEKESVEGDTVEEVSMEGDTKEDQTEEGDDSVESATKETEEKSGEDSSEASAPEEEELTKESIIPENLRARDHITQILKLEEDSDLEVLLTKAIDNTLKSLKNIYDSAIKPLELLYKYRDLSNRHYGDPEIFSKPLVLFMGPWSGGKSSTINYLVDNEFTPTALRTGAEPSPAYFNILMHGEEEEILDGTQLAADWTFSGLQKFGQGLLDRLRGVKLPRKILEKVNIVEIPGILEIRKQVQRLFPFNDACQWFIDRADIIFLVYDPAKLDVGPETEAILDQLKGREYQTRIVLNKADTVKPEELMRVQGTLIWNISPLMSSQEPPVMYSVSLWSLPYESGAPTRLLLAQERALLKDLREAIDKRIENKISSARRFAVRVRNHAKMVDCYLTTYYNHKSFFGNKKRISDDIIENPQKYHIYEGLSTLTNISRYDLPDPEMYRDFFKLNPLYDFTKLSDTCTYFRGCPINKLDVAIAYDLPELVGKYKKAVEQAREQIKKTNS